LIVTNSTVSGNRTLNTSSGAGGGIYIAHPNVLGVETVDAFLRNVTVTQNISATGGGVAALNADRVRVRMANSIVSENFNRPQEDPNRVRNNLVGRFDIANMKFNLVGSGSPILNLNGQSASLDSTNITSDMPLLSPLGFYGGPTPTHALQYQPEIGIISPAIDAGSIDFDNHPLSGANLESDQRGTGQPGTSFPRVFDITGVTLSGKGPVDIGAYEIGMAKVVDVQLDNPTGWIRDPYSFAELVPKGEQLRPISTQGVNTISIHFSEHVRMRTAGGALDTINGSVLQLVKTVRNSDGSATTTTISGADVLSFSYVPETHVATWTFTTTPPPQGQPDRRLVDGKYAIHLATPAGAMAGVVDASNVPLNGEWKNQDGGTPDTFTDDPGQSFVSGSDIAGSTSNKFRFHFSLLAGDYDRDGVVTSTEPPGDGDGDNQIGDPEDIAIRDAQVQLGQVLPLRKLGGADLDDDEIVNSGDLTRWNNGWNDSGVEGDIDGDGDSDGNDFLLWQRILGDQSAWYVGTQLSPALLHGSPPSLIGLPPQVLNVIVSGSLSTHAPFSFTTVDGSGNQLKSVPVGGADTVSMVFSEDVNVSAESLIVVGLLTFNLPELAEFSYDAASHTATWRYEGWALGDNFLLALSDQVTDVDGNWLDGEWTNPASTSTVNAAVSEFPSGNGQPGGWFNFVMTLLPGDANLDGVVNGSDYNIMAANWGAAMNKLFSEGDFDGDGAVNVDDYNLLALNWNRNLQTLSMRADFDGDYDVDAADIAVIDQHGNMTGATWADGDLNGDGTVTMADLDLAYAQFGLELDVVS